MGIALMLDWFGSGLNILGALVLGTEILCGTDQTAGRTLLNLGIWVIVLLIPFTLLRGRPFYSRKASVQIGGFLRALARLLSETGEIVCLLAVCNEFELSAGQYGSAASSGSLVIRLFSSLAFFIFFVYAEQLVLTRLDYILKDSALGGYCVAAASFIFYLFFVQWILKGHEPAVRTVCASMPWLADVLLLGWLYPLLHPGFLMQVAAVPRIAQWILSGLTYFVTIRWFFPLLVYTQRQKHRYDVTNPNFWQQIGRRSEYRNTNINTEQKY